jgi:hypothetical protein
LPTLEELEGDVWGEPEYDSYLVKTCHRLRKKPIETFSVEDLRIMVGQTIGLEHLLPRVLIVLERDPFAEGDFYPGDLMTALVRPANWPSLRGEAARVKALCQRVLARIADMGEDGVEVAPGRIVFPDLAANIRADLEAYLNPKH